MLLEPGLVLDFALLAFLLSLSQLFFYFSLTFLTGSLILGLPLQAGLFCKGALLFDLTLVSFDRGFSISLSLGSSVLCSFSLIFYQLLNFFPFRCGCFFSWLSLLQLLRGDVLSRHISFLQSLRLNGGSVVLADVETLYWGGIYMMGKRLGPGRWFLILTFFLERWLRQLLRTGWGGVGVWDRSNFTELGIA